MPIELKWIFLLMVIAVLLCIPNYVSAYLDPGTGSYLFQILFATFLGGVFTLKLFWKKIRILLRNLFSRKRPEKTG